jgi:glycine hydroxymethyltransferase
MSIAPVSSLLSGLEHEAQASSKALHLTANENVLSKTATALITSSLYGRYHLGNANKRAFSGSATTFFGLMLKALPAVHELEKRAHAAAQRLFSAEYVDFRPLSGVHAIIATLAAITKPGDLVYCLDAGQGGHFATASILAGMGRRCAYLPWDDDRSALDLERTAAALRAKPANCIYLDHSNSLFPIDIAALRAVAGNDVVIVYDGSHPLGLIAGGAFSNPLHDGCDILQGSTHKTFPGPQKGLIMTSSERLAKKISDGLDTFVSNQHSGDVLALYLTMLEMEQSAKDYAEATVRNAVALAQFARANGFSVFSCEGSATRSHQVLIDGFSGDDHLWAASKLAECGVSVNAKRTLSRNVIRIGVQEVTRRGFLQSEMRTVSDLLHRAIVEKEPSDRIRSEVHALMARFPSVNYSFDNELLQHAAA